MSLMVRLLVFNQYKIISMSSEEILAKIYCDNHMDEMNSILSKAYIEGYLDGLKKSHEVCLDGIRYIDLGLPSGNLWSLPICVKHQYTYVTYQLSSYLEVSELDLPTLEDVLELQKYCKVITNAANVAKDVVIVGPNGERISIGTQDYRNNGNPNGMLCRRQGEEVNLYESKFWIKSEVKENEAVVGVVNFKEATLTSSSHFTGYKLPYLLVKRTK